MKISKQLERQAAQLARIEKVVLPLQKSFNRIDKQSNTIKQPYSEVTQLQKQILNQDSKTKPGFSKAETRKKSG